jgi:hypothetical protein
MAARAGAVSSLIVTVPAATALGIGSWGEFHNSLAAVLANLGR